MDKLLHFAPPCKHHPNQKMIRIGPGRFRCDFDQGGRHCDHIVEADRPEYHCPCTRCEALRCANAQALIRN